MANSDKGKSTKAETEPAGDDIHNQDKSEDNVEEPEQGEATVAKGDSDVLVLGSGDAPIVNDDDADTIDASADAEDGDTPEDDVAEPDISADAVTDQDNETPEPAPREDSAEAEAPQVIERVIEKRGGFAPLVLGGAIAAVLGYGAANYANLGANDVDPFEAETKAALSDQSGQIEALKATVDSLAGRPDPSGMIADIAALSGRADGIATELTGLSKTLASLDARVTEVEKRPIDEGVSEAAIAAYERELDALRQAIADQRASVEAMAAEARQTEAGAEELATQARIRAALGRIQAAMDGGAPFAEPLKALSAETDVPISEALAAVAGDGVATLPALQGQFPDAARAALVAARRADSESGGGLRSFLELQLGARSLTPREGDDPDAVLSRAEAALRQGDLAQTLGELDLLPAAASAEMSDWRELAEARLAAKDAVAALAAELEMN